ncbi:IS66 family transposase [Photobacterium iliopiscarium]|uniref:IS66 family transposase n=1 Tax=Photobacterium iliopiscarium TaxID=56192 RepID=UPI0009E3B903|nr:IS66 family transposase [Photobacterium iliopiscarium]
MNKKLSHKSNELVLLRALFAEKEAQNNELQLTVDKLNDALKESEARYQSLLEKMQLARHRQFGASSESLPKEDCVFNEAEEVSSDTEDEDEEFEVEDNTSLKPHFKPKGRQRLPEDLPRERVIVDVPEEEKTCSCCQVALSSMGEDTSEKLVYVPAKLYVEVTVRPKYVCRLCETKGEKTTIVMATPPASIIPKGIATPSLLAQIITHKYHYALPLYRQESLFRQYGITLSRKTMSQWILRCADAFEPLMAHLKANLLTQPVLFADETTLTVLEDPKKKSYIWLYGCGSDRGGCAEHPGIVLFDYQDGSRGHDCPISYLSGYGGYLHVDGYSAYEKTDSILVGCLAHARRKFVEAENCLPKGRQGKGGKTQWALNWFQKIYRIEKEIKELSSESKYTIRQSQSKALLDTFKKWLDKSVTEVPPKSKLGEAIRYTLNQWSKLNRFIDDGQLSIDNNRAERSVRPFTVGRNNWLFSNTHRGARASAVLYSLIETAKANDCEPYAYLEYVLHEIPKLKSDDDLTHLLPWNIPKITRQDHNI